MPVGTRRLAVPVISNTPPVRNQSFTVRLPEPPMLPSARSILLTELVPVAVSVPLLVIDPVPVIAAVLSVSAPSFWNSRSRDSALLKVPLRPPASRKVPPLAMVPPLHVKAPFGPLTVKPPVPSRLPPEKVRASLKFDALASSNDPEDNRTGLPATRLFAWAVPPVIWIVPKLDVVSIVTSRVRSGTTSLGLVELSLQLDGVNQLKSPASPSQKIWPEITLMVLQLVPVQVNNPLPMFMDPEPVRATLPAVIVRLLSEVASVSLMVSVPVVLITVL